MVDSQYFTLYWKHIPYNSCTSLIWFLCFISIFLGWHLGSEPTLQLKSSTLRALPNETHMRASILNTGGGGGGEFDWMKWSEVKGSGNQFYENHESRSSTVLKFLGLLPGRFNCSWIVWKDSDDNVYGSSSMVTSSNTHWLSQLVRVTIRN